MSMYDSYMSFPGNNNTWGGKVRRRKNTGKLSSWQKFIKEYKKVDPSASFTKISKEYKSLGCSKKYTNCKKKTMTKSKSCKGYTKKLKSLKSKSAKRSLTQKCKGYTRKNKRRGKGLYGASFGGCLNCNGEGVFGGCQCCGMQNLGSGKPISSNRKRCLSSRSLYNRLNEMRARIMADNNEQKLTDMQRGKLLGAYRQAMSMYSRGNLLGDQYIIPDNSFNKFPGLKANYKEWNQPYPPLV